MKLLIFFLPALFLSFYSIAQNNVIDSLYKKLDQEKTDTGKAIILYNLSYYYQNYKPDSALLLAQKSYALSAKHKFLRGESWSLGNIAGAFRVLDNYPKAIEYFIEQLKIEEKRNIPENLGTIYISMSEVYNSEHDADKSLYYAFQADSIVKEYKLPELALYTYLNIGDIYEKANKLDSALQYTQRCYQLSLQQKNDLITGTALNNLGNIYIKKGSIVEAHNSYEQSIPYLEAKQDYNTLAECKLGLANVYQQEGKADSARYYAKQSFVLAYQNEFLKRVLDASAFLEHLYKSENKIDSAYAYQQIMMNLRDSIESKERIKQLQSITIAEQIRQKDIAEAKQQEAEDRKEKMQLLSIGITIPVLFFISVYLSRKKVHKKVIEFSGVLSLLMLFEYITLLVHPLVADQINHSPILEIIIFVAIAALLTPTHHKIQAWLINRLSKMHEHHLQSHVKAKKITAPDENN